MTQCIDIQSFTIYNATLFSINIVPNLISLLVQGSSKASLGLG